MTLSKPHPHSLGRHPLRHASASAGARHNALRAQALLPAVQQNQYCQMNAARSPQAGDH